MAISPDRVVSAHFPYVPIHLELGQRQLEIEALLDTGFDGDVVIPVSLLAGGQNPDGHQRWTLADGSTVLAPYYIGSISVGSFGSHLAIVTVLAEEPLIGIGVAKHFTITLDHGSQVIVEP